jgi:hypothetical protein
MKKILTTILLLCASVCAFAASGQRTSIALQPVPGGNVAGNLPFAQVVANAQISVCVFTTTPRTCGTPVNIYSDVNLTHLITQPLAADPVNGFYQYYVQANTQVIEKVCAPYNQCQYYPVFISGSGSGSAGPLLSTDSVPNASQVALNFIDPVSFNGISFAWSNPSGGLETFGLSGTLNNSGITNPQTTVNGQTCVLGSSCTIASGSGLQMLVNPPISGNFAIVRPTSFTLSAPTGPGSVANNNSGKLIWACTGVLCNLSPNTIATWSGFVLPAGISAANVTSIYAYSINGASPFTTAISSSFQCASAVVEPGVMTWPIQQTTNLTGVAGSAIGTITCTATLFAGGAPGPSGLIMNVADVGLIVYYSSGSYTAPNMTSVAVPLFYNSSLSELGIDTTGIGGTTTNSLTAAASGGASPGSTFNGSAAVTFDYHSFGAAPLASPTFTGTVTTPALDLSSITGSTQCLHVNSSGLVSGTGSDCGSAGSGVSSLNSLTGGLTLAAGSNITITPSGGNTLTIASTGGAGSSVQYNATSTTYTVTGSSINGDDGHILGPTITVTGGSSSGGVCTVTNSGTNGLSVGDWVYTAGITGWPAQGAAYGVYTYGSGTVNDDQFQVISTGLSSSQFEFNCPNAGSVTFSGGSAYPSNYWFTHLVEKQPFFNGHGTVNAIFDSTHTCTGINTNFSTLFPNISGHVGYFILTDCHNEYNTGSSASSVETIIQSIMAKAHTAGYVFVLGTTPNAQIAALNNGSYSFALNTVNWWSYTQGKSNANASSGQYTDYVADFNAPLSDYQLTGGSNTGIGSAAGNPDAAAILNEALATQNFSPKTQTPFCYFGWYTGVLANASGPGYVCSPGSVVDAFVVTDATQTNIALHVDTSGTIGIREPNDTVATALNLSYIGSSANLLCTTTNGKVVNTGCSGMTSISSPDSSININTPSGTPTLQLSRDVAYTFDNTNTYLAPSTTGSSAVFQATGITRPTIVQSTGGYNGSATWTTTTGHAIVAFCQNSGSIGTDAAGDTFHVIQNTSTLTMSYAYNITGATGSVGCAGGTGYVVYELANVPTTAFLDVSSQTAVTSSPQTVSLTTTQANDLLLTGIIAYNTGLGTQTANGTWVAGPQGLQGEAATFQNTTLAGAAGAYPITLTFSGGVYQVILMAAFKGVTASQSADIVPFKTASGTVVSKINLDAYMQTVATIFSTLPSCVSGLEGTVAAVTDSTTNTYGATITGSGSDHVPAYCNGTNWIVY